MFGAGGLLYSLIYWMLKYIPAADMEGLFGPNGGKRPLKSYNGLYLTEDMAHRRAITRGWATWRKVETHYWTIEKINEKEVFRVRAPLCFFFAQPIIIEHPLPIIFILYP